MNRTMIIIGVIVLVLIGGGLFMANQNSNQTEQAKMEQKEAAIMEKDPSAASGQAMTDDKMTDSRYVEYSKAALDKAAGNRRVLFFYASWCPTCRPTDTDLTTNKGKIPEDVTVIRINYNDPDTDQEEKDLAKKYGITYQHTFVQVDSQGKEVTKWNGGRTDELLANIK